MAESPVDRYLELILRQRSDLDREEVLRLIDNKRKEATVSEKYKGVWAALMVAHELGVRFDQDISDSDLRISDLTAGMSSVTVRGRIISIFPPKEFSRGGELGGRFVKLLVGDQTGWATLMVWREKVDLVESQTLKPNDVIRVRKAYCREGRFGRPELHIGQSGTIVRLKEEDGLPDRKEFYTKPSQLTKDLRAVNIRGSITGLSSIREFVRSDGTSGKVRRVILGDERANVSGSLWNEQVDALSEVDVGKMLYVTLAKTRQGRDGETEFAADRGSYVEVGEESAQPLVLTSISELGQRVGLVNVYATVTRMFPPKTVKVTGLGDRRAQEIVLHDNTGQITLTIWGDRSFPALIEGRHVILRNAKIRHRDQGLSLTIGAIGNIEAAESGMPPIQEPKVLLQRLGELKAGMRNIIIEGLVSQPVEVTEVTTSSGEQVSRATTMLADDTGELQVVAWREAIEKIGSLRPGSVVRLRWVITRANPFNGRVGVVVTSNTEVEVEKPASG